MDVHVIDYYSTYSEPGPHGHFHKVLALHETPRPEWPEIAKIVSGMPHGWYELAKLSVQDRIEFIRDFWMAKFPYHPQLCIFLNKFFSSLDDVGVFLTQQKYDDPFDAHLVYSLADNGGFFHGECPASGAEIIDLQNAFQNCILPSDYLAFLQIHNGFAKLTDTGIIPSIKMKEAYQSFQQMLIEGDRPIGTKNGSSVNPASLIPFYESFGMPYFQCFWKDWYPDQEMGNVYYSVPDRVISTCEKKDECAETLSFQTFTDWFIFYLEKID